MSILGIHLALGDFMLVVDAAAAAAAITFLLKYFL